MIEERDIELRVYGEPSLPTLVYLPGLHGDWTLIGSFRKAVEGRVRFVEMTYPRTLEWSLADYAAGVENALGAKGITSGWLLAESFGSQVAWAMLERGRFKAKGLVLAGGFVRHPARWAVSLARAIGGTVPLRAITAMLFGYGKIARYRFRKSPEVASGIGEFIRRRTELDRKAAVHRLGLIFDNNACAVACNCRVPLYAITGGIDPVVPWLFVRAWLRRNCPALRQYVIIPGADHNVLGTAPERSAGQVLEWINAPIEVN